MGAESDIEWTGATWTSIRARNRRTGKVGWHCEHMSEACRFCYAETRNRWIGTGLHYKPGHRDDIELFLDEEMLLVPLRWRRPRMIFVCSMTDLFGSFVRDAWIIRNLAVMALADHHTFQVLTKRPERMAEIICDPATPGLVDAAMDEIAPEHWCKRELDDVGGWPLRNMWAGTSAEDQKTFDARWAHLRRTSAAVRFLSYEPALGPLDLQKALNVAICRTTPWSAESGEPCGPSTERWIPAYNVLTREVIPPALHWVIAGGESGHRARPAHPDWFRQVRDQGLAAGVPFHFKQWGMWAPQRAPKPNELVDARRELIVPRRGEVTSGLLAYGDDAVIMRRHRTKADAGRVLDGRTWDEVPAVTLAAQPAATEVA